MESVLYVISTAKSNIYEDGNIFTKHDNMWANLSKLNIPSDTHKYVVYSKYNNNIQGDYDMCVAVDFPCGNNILRLIPLKYQVYELYKTSNSNMNRDLDLVVNKWLDIWEEADNAIIKRTYITDYEKHYPDGKVEIYVSIE